MKCEGRIMPCHNFTLFLAYSYIQVIILVFINDAEACRREAEGAGLPQMYGSAE
jgi:hypothetical protein